MPAQTPSLVSTYLYLALNRLEYAESFYAQVRAIEQLASVLAELGDEDAKKILVEAIKFEDEAILLDTVLAEMRVEIHEGNLAEFDPEVKKRIVRLRHALERFKAKLLVELDEKLKGKVPVVWGDVHGKR